MKTILLDGMVYCHPIFQCRPYFRAYHTIHKGVVIHDALCSKIDHRVQTWKHSIRNGLPIHWLRVMPLHDSPWDNQGATIRHISAKGRYFSIPFKSVCRTRSHRINSVSSGGIAPNKQRMWVYMNTRIACGDLPIMIGHRIQIRHEHIKNEVQGTSCLKPRFVFYDITATPLRQSRLWKSRCSCNVHLVEARGIEPLSENPSIHLSPSAVYRFCSKEQFPLRMHRQTSTSVR